MLFIVILSLVALVEKSNFHIFMSIEKHITEGLILKKYEQGEHDLVFKIYTREYGIIFVLAKSIRKITSKLRMKMQVGRFVIITAVRGREVWRLTGVEEYAKNSQLDELKSLSLKINFLICECINRFLPLEKSYKKLFDRMKEIYESESVKNIDQNNMRGLIYFVVLVETGYADAKVIGVKNLEEYINFSVKDLHTHFILNEKEVKNHLRKVLSESML
jgi:hypothetical protein